MTVMGKIAFDASGTPPGDLTPIRLTLGPSSPGDPANSVAEAVTVNPDVNGHFSVSRRKVQDIRVTK